MSDIHETLTKKVGPLPAGAWGAVILGGLGISWWWRNHHTSSTAAVDPNAVNTATPPTTDGTGGAAQSLPSVTGTVSPPTDPTVAGDTGVSGETPITTNGQWRQQAVKVLVGSGHSGISAENAVGKFLYGATLSEAEAAMINTAIAALGPPPQPVPPIRVKAAPKPKPKPKPPAHHPAPHPVRPPAPKPPKHSPIAHHNQPTHQTHQHRAAPPQTRRDVGLGTNPGR